MAFKGQRFDPAYLHQISLENQWFSRLFSVFTELSLICAEHFDSDLTQMGFCSIVPIETIDFRTVYLRSAPKTIAHFSTAACLIGSCTRK